MYSYRDVLDFIEDENVKFIRLTFFDIYGTQKNVSIMSEQIERAVKEGIAIDASAILGFNDETQSDLFLHPDFSTISLLPWRPSQGSVARVYCDIKNPDGTLFEKDCRLFLKNAIEFAKKKGITVFFGTEMEFYLFKLDENGNNTKIPFDNASYMDISPEDKGENVRREICLTLQSMGINPEASHHEEGPAQNEIDFEYSDALSSADNAASFKWVVRSTSGRNGLYADFSPKPLENHAGSGMHINVSVKSTDKKDYLHNFMSGVMTYVPDMTFFLNPCENSYERLGRDKAPKYVTWSHENRSQLVRVPAVKNNKNRFELRSPDCVCNPYIVFALMIYAGLEGITNKLSIEETKGINLLKADDALLKNLEKLPDNLESAKETAKNSLFLKKYMSKSFLDAFLD